MKRAVAGLLAAGCVLAAGLTAQERVPFKVGTFDLKGRVFVGVVVRDTDVIDLPAALTSTSSASAPVDMKDLIARYDSTFQTRIRDVVAALNGKGANRPPYVHDLKALTILPRRWGPSSCRRSSCPIRDGCQ